MSTEPVTDINGFWEVEDQPISKAGVFPYLGALLPGAPDPAKVYGVYRPAEELAKEETVNSFKLQPWVIQHEMLGPEAEGFTPAEKKGVHGVIGEKVYFRPETETLYGNLKCFSQELSEAKENGLKGLSLGYFHDLEWKSGEYKGQPYEAIQRNISGNHMASVKRGRMGKDVALDGLQGYDPNIFNAAQEAAKEKSMTPEELAKLAETLKQIMDRLTALEGAKTAAADEDGGEGKKPAAGDNEGEDPKNPGQDEAGAAKAEGQDNDPAAELTVEKLAEVLEAIGKRLERLEAAKAAAQDEDKDKDKGKGASMDSAITLKSVLQEVAGRDKLASRVAKRVGTFDHDEMTLAEVAAYGCEKLGLRHGQGDAQAMLEGYLQGADKAAGLVFSLDESHKPAQPTKGSAKMQEYLKEGK